MPVDRSDRFHHCFAHVWPQVAQTRMCQPCGYVGRLEHIAEDWAELGGRCYHEADFPSFDIGVTQHFSRARAALASMKAVAEPCSDVQAALCLVLHEDYAAFASLGYACAACWRHGDGRGPQI